MKREYNESIKYVETSEPDKVADYIDDLNNQLAEKDKKIEFYEKHDNYAYNISGLEKLLKRKDEEIEELKEQVEIWQKLLFEKMETQIIGVTNEKLKQIRHQVCEEIRKSSTINCIDVIVNGKPPFNYYTISEANLDQIERGDR